MAKASMIEREKKREALVKKYAAKRAALQAIIEGSIAFFLQDILEEVLAENNLKLGTVLRKPIDGLVAFHVNKFF